MVLFLRIIDIKMYAAQYILGQLQSGGRGQNQLFPNVLFPNDRYPMKFIIINVIYNCNIDILINNFKNY